MTEFGTTLPTSPGLCPCGGGLKSHVAHQQPAEICQVSDAYSSTCLPPVTVPAQSLPCQRCHLSPYLRSHCPVSAATCHRTCAVTALSALPRHLLTCIPVPRVTHRLVQLSAVRHITCHVSSPGVATSPVRPVQSACHVALYGLYSHPPPPPFFHCLGFRTERDVFRIRSPLDEADIWPESGRRDGRNGAGFVGFGALSFLSLFGPYQASGSSVMSVEEGEGA
jgi:hypothetical protein